MKAWFSRHPIISFFICAYVYSWVIAVPLALRAQGVLAVRIPLALHYLTVFGPALGALTVGRLIRKGDPPAPQRHRIPSLRWLAVGLFSPMLLFLIAQLIGWLLDAEVPGWLALGHLNFLPDLGFGAWFFWLLTSGGGEEIGWRGFALPRLQQRHSALASSALLSIAWAGWHVPLFFYVPSYVAMGFRILPGFFIGILAGSIVLTWLYNSSGGSILAAALWHASFNYVSGSTNAVGLAAAVTSTMVIVWAVVIMWRCGTALTSSPIPSKRPEKPHFVETHI